MDTIASLLSLVIESHKGGFVGILFGQEKKVKKKQQKQSCLNMFMSWYTVAHVLGATNPPRRHPLGKPEDRLVKKGSSPPPPPSPPPPAVRLVVCL